MTKLSDGMERFLGLLSGRVCMAKWDAAEKAAALIRAYEEEREAVKHFLATSSNDPFGKTEYPQTYEYVQEWHNTNKQPSVDSLKAELEK